MNRNRLILRLALIAVAAGIFFVRGGQHKPDFMYGFIGALAVALVVVGIRAAMESKQRKKTEQDQQLAAEGKKVDLFTKPKDF
jgi:cadmium resistance protein CadD (predicted permease)